MSDHQFHEMKSSFSASWLTLREPVDHRSRAEALLPPLLSWRHPVRQFRVVDLGAGSGSNLRYLAPRLGGAQSWLLLDHDPRLLALARPPHPDVICTPREIDLRDLAQLPLGGSHLVTASALLDLVSHAWLQELIARCADVGAALLFTLNIDGQVDWQQSDPDDAEVGAAFAAHHRGDKGFGPALATNASAVCCDLLRKKGYVVSSAASPWCLDAADRTLYCAWVDGWAAAAQAQQPASALRTAAWCQRRQRRLTPVRIGHIDILALPTAPSRDSALAPVPVTTVPQDWRR